MHFGKWLRSKRTERGYSLRELAARTNGVCTFGYINQLEHERSGKKGIYQPDQEIVTALATALDADVNEARLAAGYAPQESAGFLFRLGEGLIGFESLTEAQRDMVVQNAQVLIDTFLKMNDDFKLATVPVDEMTDENDTLKKKRKA